ncbi:Carbonic anhydrase-related protein 10 [Trachymyrmex zeteki]|uniref:Carbonic anhydrase-related protein 10 n=1 Tax=Mycetomoellerius zeteki TaxID=64791 RepID=A0A151XJB6_9HYME|nr:Carbonic anhydrase-related protein 10 [Trachymyrmex zeteki]
MLSFLLSRLMPVARVRKRPDEERSASVASELSGTCRKNEYEIDRARERATKEGKGKERRENGESAHAEGREEGHTWRVRHDNVERREREMPWKEKGIQAWRRGVGGRALLTKLFRDRGEKKEIGRTGERGGIRDSGEKIGRIKDREYPWKALGRRAANLPRRARRHRPPAASSSKGTPACVARVVVAAVDGEIGGRSGAPAEKEEEEEKKDVVLFVVHGQYPLVLTSERERRTVCRGESTPVSWEEWWTYDGISGPAFWGLINPEWWLCNKGRRQSPVNLDPNQLLFDPNLQPLHLDKHRINGILANTGHSVVFAVENDTRHPVNISGGPLSYRYQFHEIHLHFGADDRIGSEHTVDGHAFPAEFFNLKSLNTFKAFCSRVGDLSNPELRTFTQQLDKIKYGVDVIDRMNCTGQAMEIKRFGVRELLPDTKHYMTYDGSTTMPACHETTTWIILNKPIYITKQQASIAAADSYKMHAHAPALERSRARRELHALRQLMQGDEKQPNAPLANNFRPPQPLHHRPVRTNIDFNVQGPKNCPTMNKDIYYKGIKQNRSDSYID